jgi:D-arabinitol 2-dehydrogenase
MAEGLVEAGGKVHCLDIGAEPPKTFEEARTRHSGGDMCYHQVDVTKNDVLEDCIASIAADKQRLDGLIAGMSHRVVQVVNND